VSGQSSWFSPGGIWAFLPQVRSKSPPLLECPVLSACLCFWFCSVAGTSLGKQQTKTSSHLPFLTPPSSFLVIHSQTAVPSLVLRSARELSHALCSQRDHSPLRDTLDTHQG
jgi:hypothetical protein